MLGKALELEIKPQQVDIAHRLKSRNKAYPPPSIIKFVNRWKKDVVLARTKEKKPTADISGGARNMRIFCNERLTPKCQNIFNHARQIRETHWVWTKKGKVLCREKSPDGKPVQLLDVEDVDAILETQKRVEEKYANSVQELSQPGNKRPRDVASPSSSPTNDAARGKIKKSYADGER